MSWISRSLLFVIAVFTAASTLPCVADPEDISDDEQLPPGYVRSIDAFNSGFSTADSLTLASEYAAGVHNIDQAIRLARRALEKCDEDLDVHKALATALELKIAQQKDPDPRLFNECVKEWLIVMRNERGPDKGLTRKNGKGNARINKLYEDEAYTIPAAMQLKALVGRVPSAKESDADFIKKVGKPAELEVRAKLLPPGSIPKDNHDQLQWMNQ